MGFWKSTGPSNADIKEMFKNISSGVESLKTPSKQDLRNQIKLANLVQTLQEQDKKNTKKLKLKQSMQPFWKVYLTFWSNIKYQTYNKKIFEHIINNFFENTFSKKDLENTFNEINEGLKIIKSLNVYPKIEQEINETKKEVGNNINKKTLIKYIIKTNTTIGQQFCRKFIDQIKADVIKITSTKDTKEEIVDLEAEIMRKSNPSSELYISSNKNKNNFKQFTNLINKSLIILENIFLNELADLYLNHSQQKDGK